MLKRILVANRGEIAVRVIRACREMNIETVAVYSEADRGALFTTLATRAVCIGPARAEESYMNADALLTVALAARCDGVHPGFGFLSENAAFAAAVRERGLTFVGPPPEVIAALGDKSAARRLMRSVGVPVVPGSDGLTATIEDARREASGLGYPVLVKAAAGGGGRGIRRADSESGLESAFNEASAEALACFSDGGVYIEKLIENPKHIELQILADSFGNIIHLGERDCTLQRRNQKVLEEAPAPSLAEERRRELGDAAVRAARAAGYINAGTVEFIQDGGGECYFIEMNTRIQVEHPVTEMITGVDIVREQLRIASGLPLRYAQEDIAFNGHAIECRVNAESPEDGFLPCPGKIGFLHLPGGFGVRVDSAAYPGCEVTPYYDSMLAKVIVHGRTRNEAVLRMRRALEELLITGVKTNLGLLYMLMFSTDFLAGKTDTGFIERNLDALLKHISFDNPQGTIRL
ncbi:MAG: acetyl-CoA carboxylase biotin carboxylase subunit [Oscillospiraceae bacterium]|jgi:acetyl-CoA carboxylase biotin carboxylase subunit|nr:acetyl-CoA carboxylase biotin carboxylase subunit [Oscillospiraceae bacterium]